MLWLYIASDSPSDKHLLFGFLCVDEESIKMFVLYAICQG